MKKWFALLLMLVMVGSLLVGCGESDPDKIIVAEVGGQKITKTEAEEVYPIMVAQLLSMYEQYGMAADPASKDFITSAKTSTLAVMTEGLALDQKLTALGGGLTDEEREGFKAAAQAEYDETLASYMEANELDEEATRAELTSYGYTPGGLAYSNYRTEIETRLREYALADITLDVEQIREKYNELVAAAKETYAATPDQFVNDYINGATIYTTPEGYRLVKNLVIGYDETNQALLTEKSNEFYNALFEQYILGMDHSSKTEPTEEETAEYEAQNAALTETMDKILEEEEAIRAVALEATLPRAEEILAQVQAEGADFEALMAEYSVDTPTESVLATGYPVSETTGTYVASFTEGAMALKEIGDISGLIASDYGYHILQYVGDLAAGDAPFEQVQADVEGQLRTSVEEETFYAKLGEWIEAADIKTYINRY